MVRQFIQGQFQREVFSRLTNYEAEERKKYLF